MKAAEVLLVELREAGVTVTADGGQLRINAPIGIVTPLLRERMVENKPALLELFGRRMPEHAQL